MGLELFSTKAVLILDNDGNRVRSKYYDDHFPTQGDQKTFEKSLFKKTNSNDSEIIVISGLTVCFKSSVDLLFYVVGSSDENELMLASTLNTFYEAISGILKKNVEKRALFDKLDQVLLVADELIEGGVLLENDPNNILSRVCVKTDDVPISEQTMTQVFQSAREGLKWSLLR